MREVLLPGERDVLRVGQIREAFGIVVYESLEVLAIQKFVCAGPCDGTADGYASFRFFQRDDIIGPDIRVLIHVSEPEGLEQIIAVGVSF